MTDGPGAPERGSPPRSGNRWLDEALASLEPPLPPDAADRLRVLLDLLQEWEGAGVTGFKGPATLVQLYFREALDLRRHLPGDAPCLDIGSGGGTPALPLALAGSGSTWTLLEPRRVAASFLELAIAEVGLSERARVVRQTLHQFLNSSEGSATISKVRAATLRAVRLRRVEWRGLARTLSPGAVVIWPTSGNARDRAAIPAGLYREERVPADRGIVWLGHVSRETRQPAG